jgi:hypothetical protein
MRKWKRNRNKKRTNKDTRSRAKRPRESSQKASWAEFQNVFDKDVVRFSPPKPASVLKRKSDTFSYGYFKVVKLPQSVINEMLLLCLGTLDRSGVVANPKRHGFKDALLYRKGNDVKKRYVQNDSIRKSLKKVISDKRAVLALITYLTEQLRSLLHDVDFIIDDSHFDFLLYGHGGHFKPHRDDVMLPGMQQHVRNGYVPHTMLIGVDSNITKYGDGATHVWNRDPPVNELHKDISGFNHKRHIFTSSKKNYVTIFPSESLHSSQSISTPGDFKFVMKFDIMLKEPDAVWYPVQLLSPGTILNAHICPCDACNPQSQHFTETKCQKVFYCKYPYKQLLNKDVILKIASFLGNIVKCSCCKKIESTQPSGDCHCLCSRCVKTCHYEEDEYDEYDDYYNYYYNDNDNNYGYNDNDDDDYYDHDDDDLYCNGQDYDGYW